jgi:hypothetical protein
MTERGEGPPEPQILSGFSGPIRVRMPRTLHRKLAGRAWMEHVCLNTLIVSLLADGIGAMEEVPLVERRARRPKRIGADTSPPRAGATPESSVGGTSGRSCRPEPVIWLAT